MPQIILRLDSTALRKSFCNLLFYRMVVEGYRAPGQFNDTRYGTGLHKFIAVMQESGGNFAAANVAGMRTFNFKSCAIRNAGQKNNKAWLNESHFIKTCFDYWEHLEKHSDVEHLINPFAKCWKCEGSGDILDKDGNLQYDENDNVVVCDVCNGNRFRPQPMVEQKFEIKYFENDQVIVYIVGTLDDLVKIKNGCYCVDDYKTTGSWDIEKYLRSYRLSPQLKLYVWAVKRLAKENPDGPLGELNRLPVGSRIKGIFLKSNRETVFQDSEVFQFKPEEMAIFEALLHCKVQQLVHMVRNPAVISPDGLIEGTCNLVFGPCDYINVCGAVDSIAAQHLLKRDFIKREYNPLKFAEDNE